MKNCFLLLSLLLLQLQPAKASHVLGGEMSYKCLGNGIFEFTVAFYRDCSGIAWDQTSVTVNGPSGTFTLNRLPGVAGITDISQRCATATSFGCGTNPASGTGPNGTIARLTYKGTTNLSALPAPPASGYVFFVNNISVNVRNNNNNMGGGSSMGLRVMMYRFENPATGNALTPAQMCDNSPDFMDAPAALHILNPQDTARISSFAIDSDLDSLVYKIDFPWTNTFTPMFYTAPYSVFNPLPNTPSVLPSGTPAMNPKTGTLSFRPSQAGNFLTCFKVESWRCGQKISEVYRDFQLQIISSPSGSPAPYVPGNLTTQRAPIITPPALSPTGQAKFEFDYFVGDVIDVLVAATDYYPLFNANFDTLPAPAGEFSIVAKGAQLSTTNNPNGDCLLPPCATLRGLTDPAPPAAVVTPPMNILAGNGTALGLGYNASLEGGGRLTWLPECSNLSSSADSACNTTPSPSTFQFAAVAVDKNCPIVGKEVQVYTFNIWPLPAVTPANLTSISLAGSLNQLNFVTNFDTLSIDPIDAANYADSSIAYQRAKSVNRRYASFQGYQVYKSLLRMGPYQLMGTITNPFETSWIDSSNTLGQFYFIATVSGCVGSVSSDTLSTCQTQNVAVSAPAGPYYCPNTGTLLQATGNPVGNKQWYKNGDPIPGANSATYLVTDDGDYVLGVTDSTGCQSFSALQSMVPTNLPYEGEEICAVTVDLASGLNKLLWVKTPEAGIAAYQILRENVQTGDFDPIAVVPFADAGIFIDSTVNAQLFPVRYKIQALDVCTRSSSESPVHRTMHLRALQSGQFKVSLNWTAYEGRGVGYYSILRSTGGNFTFIGSTSANVLNFEDEFAPAGPKAYLIWLDNTTLCPIGTGIHMLYSNVVGLGSGVHTELLSSTAFKMYPNPTTGLVRIQGEHIIEKLSVRDMQGRLVLSEFPDAAGIDLNLSTLNKGVYLVEIMNAGQLFYQRLVLQ